MLQKKIKNTPKALKYKLYRQLRMEIWGTYILKKKNNKFTLRLLRGFEYYLTRKILSKFNNRQDVLNKCFSSFFNLTLFEKKAKSSLKFWLNFNKISHNLYNKFSLMQGSVLSSIKFSRLKVYRYLKKLSIFKSKLCSKRNRKRRLSGSNYLSLVRLDNFNFEKRKKFWVESRLWEKKASLFYGINNIKKFRKIKAKSFYSSKLRITGGLQLELQLNIILFKIGIFGDNIFIINKRIRKGLIFVNNRLVKNPLKIIKVNDNIQVNPKLRKSVHKVFTAKMKNKLIFLKLPSYIEYNFNILYFSLVRLPTKLEILRFYFGAFYMINPSILNFADTKRSIN